MRSSRQFFVYLIAAALCGTICQAEQDKEPQSIPLPAALFAPMSRKIDELSPQKRATAEGPISSRQTASDDNAVVMRCATRGGSARGEIKPGNYFLFVQSYYMPF